MAIWCHICSDNIGTYWVLIQYKNLSHQQDCFTLSLQLDQHESNFPRFFFVNLSFFTLEGFTCDYEHSAEFTSEVASPLRDVSLKKKSVYVGSDMILG